MKAYQRRASARTNLKRYEDAAKDYNMVLDLEPNNKVAKIELDKITSKLKEEQMKLSSSTKAEIPPEIEAEETMTTKKSFENNIKTAFSSNNSIKSITDTSLSNQAKKRNTQFALKPGQIMPIDKKPHLRSKKPLKKVPITEVTNVVDRTSTLSKNSTVNRTKDSDFIIRKSSEQDSTERIESREETKQKIKIEEIDSTVVNESSPTSSIQTNTLKEEIVSISKSKGPVKKVEEDLAKSLQNVKCSSDIKSKTKPVSSVGFYGVWNGLKDASDEDKIDYLNVLQPKDYPIIFKHSLEPPVFEQILKLLFRLVTNDETKIEVASKHLYGLSKVPRISAMVMFLNQDDNNSLRRMIDDLQKCDNIRQNRKEAIKRLLQ